MLEKNGTPGKHGISYLQPAPGIEPGLTACEASMLPTTPPGGFEVKELKCLQYNG